jgi:hypothetical protein
MSPANSSPVSSEPQNGRSFSVGSFFSAQYVQKPERIEVGTGPGHFPFAFRQLFNTPAGILLSLFEPKLGEAADGGCPGRQIRLLTAPIIDVGEHGVLTSYPDRGAPLVLAGTAPGLFC